MKQNYKVLIIDDNVIDQLLQQLLKKAPKFNRNTYGEGGKQGLEFRNFKKRSTIPAHYSIRHQNATNGWL
jgi:hypothetical protein